MKTIHYRWPKWMLLLIVGALSFGANAQSDPATDYKNFPIIVTLQFHAFAVPFRDFASNFKNVGIGLGTEVSLNGDDNWVQQFNLIWYRNKALGNGLHVNTQTTWRPTIGKEGYSEIRLGVGYLYSFRPQTAFRQINGEWVSQAHQGKMMLTIPVGIAFGYHNYTSGTQVSPFLGYQLMLVNQYSKSIPLVPETLVQAGTRIHTK